MKRKETEKDNQKMTNETYINNCHEIINYLETKLENLIYEHHRALRYMPKKEFEKYLNEITKEKNTK